MKILFPLQLRCERKAKIEKKCQVSGLIETIWENWWYWTYPCLSAEVYEKGGPFLWLIRLAWKLDFESRGRTAIWSYIQYEICWSASRQVTFFSEKYPAIHRTARNILLQFLTCWVWEQEFSYFISFMNKEENNLTSVRKKCVYLPDVWLYTNFGSKTSHKFHIKNVNFYFCFWFKTYLSWFYSLILKTSGNQ